MDVNGILLDESSGYSPSFLMAILNSQLLDWRFKKGSVPFRGGYYSANKQFINGLPIFDFDFSSFDRDIFFEEQDQLQQEFGNYLTDSATEVLLESINKLINENDDNPLPLIHDFLAFLAEKMLEYNKEKQRLNSALDAFKFLNKGTAFKPFKTVFAESIKYGQLLSDDIDLGKVHHDIEDLKLEPVGDFWQLSLLLKHRDPATDWSDWKKDEDDNIVRSTKPVYQFDLSDEQGRYWQQSFEVLDQFENSSNFPGGKTRTTHEKLMESDVPIFDEKANIEPLIELREELAETEEKIEKTDWLIDQVVYRLYGLSEEEIGVVERTG